MREWLKENEPFIRLVYRIAVILLLIGIGQLIARADSGWYLSQILDLLRRR